MPTIVDNWIGPVISPVKTGCLIWMVDFFLTMGYLNKRISYFNLDINIDRENDRQKKPTQNFRSRHIRYHF